ncbi:hypothetical protein P43SY_005011 [Pythium insidiosum]|uniref:Uncharacterized protein n=1 Tax=Pythium insidiosum TaxID=114742 RepID=A0AAD5M7K6_PYTIN|nr:hypothetical protein P43SY_005011 [Pythium insidiosum]
MEEDLYGDLDTSTDALAKTEVRYEKQRIEKDNEQLRKELAVLQQENRRLGELTSVLEKNISVLFVTAQTELKRKDAEIQRLRDALERRQSHDDRLQRSPVKRRVDGAGPRQLQ